MGTITKEDFEQAEQSIKDYYRQQKEATVEYIKENFEYPIGVKDIDKFLFCGFNRDGDTIYAEIRLPKSDTAIIEITDELATALNEKWAESLPQITHCKDCSNDRCDNDKAKRKWCMQTEINRLKLENGNYQKKIVESNELLKTLSGINTSIAKRTCKFVESEILDLKDEIRFNENRIENLPELYED